MSRLVVVALIIGGVPVEAELYNFQLSSIISSYLSGPVGINGQVPQQMAGSSSIFFQAGVQYNIDPRLIVAIAGAESHFGTDWGACSQSGFNAWSWDCAENSFSSFGDGILAVSFHLSKWLLKHPTIQSIQSRYCPTGDGGCDVWMSNVTRYYTLLGGQQVYGVDGSITNLTFVPTSSPGFMSQSVRSAGSIGSWYGDNWYQLGTSFSGTLQSLTIKCSTDGGNFPQLLTDPFFYGSVTLNEFSDPGYGSLTNSYPLGKICTPVPTIITVPNLNIPLLANRYYRLDTYEGLQNASVTLFGTNQFGTAMWDTFIYGIGVVYYTYTFYPYIIGDGTP
jgi:hypothetical protein